MQWTQLVSIITSVIAALAAIVTVTTKFRFDRAIEREKARFSIGTTSHMADIVLDRHISFCEAYATAASDALRNMENGSKDEPLETLIRIRQKWALWIPQDIEKGLVDFEGRLAKIGGEARVYGPEDPLAIATLRQLLGIEELTAIRRDLVGTLSRKVAGAN